MTHLGVFALTVCDTLVIHYFFNCLEKGGVLFIIKYTSTSNKTTLSMIGHNLRENDDDEKKLRLYIFKRRIQFVPEII